MKRRESGTILVFALVMIAAGAVVLAGWISLMAARANYTEQMSAAIKRRIVLENSRLLATQYLRQHVLAGAYTGTSGASIDGGEWGRFAFTSNTAAVPLESIDLPLVANLFSPGSDGGYTTDLSARLYSDSETSFDWTFHLRSRCPMLGFDLFTAQNPTVTPSAEVIVSEKLDVTGNMLNAVYLGANAMLWPAATFSLTALTYQTPDGSAFTGRSPAPAISNFPFPPVTSGSLSVTSAYNGMFSVIDPAFGGTSTLLAKAQVSPFVSVFSGSAASVNLTESPPDPTPVDGVSCDASENVTIDLSNPALQRVYILGTGLGAPPKITLVGDPVDDGFPAILIVYVERTGTVMPLTRVELQGENYRRVHLAIKKEVGSQQVDIAPPAGTHGWRLMLTVENTVLNFTPDSGNLTIRGGIRSDNSVLVGGSGRVVIAREIEPNLLERNADRAAWLEAFAQ